MDGWPYTLLPGMAWLLVAVVALEIIGLSICAVCWIVYAILRLRDR